MGLRPPLQLSVVAIEKGANFTYIISDSEWRNTDRMDNGI